MTTNPTPEPELDMRQLLKLVVEIGPLVAFFLANSYGGIFWGTGVFMVATVIALTVSKMLFGRIAAMPLISGGFVLVFGALTLWLNNDLFIKLKPTIINSLFSFILFAGLWFGYPLLKHVFGEAFRLVDEGWRILTFRWALFFLFLACLNEIVWRNFSTDFWVSFKVFGLMPLTFVFMLSQVGLLKRYELRDAETSTGTGQGGPSA
ncbi:MAG: hypothetical protein RLZ98_631 [Pseudomonadota bacterium]|jgi:intracellular septation protein